jgi:hypothetical protein
LFPRFANKKRLQGCSARGVTSLVHLVLVAPDLSLCGFLMYLFVFFAKLFFEVAAGFSLRKKINKNSKKHATYALRLPET